MKRLVVISDVHGFYDEMIKALNNVKFNPDTDFLISCGDTMDRGPDPAAVMNYLMKLPNKILIRGNHESLFEECVKRGYWMQHDVNNGTFDSICELGGAGKDRNFEECCVIAENRVKDFFASMVNYFETKNYIFVHSFVPLKNLDGLPMYYTRNREFEINPDWRHAHFSEWEEARWGNPYELAERGFLPDKTLVFGHYHTSWPRHKYNEEPEFGENADFSIYYGNGYIAIDSCCAYSGKLNCLVIEDEFLEE